MGAWRDEPMILTRGDGGMEGIPPRPGTAMVFLSFFNQQPPSQQPVNQPPFLVKTEPAAVGEAVNSPLGGHSRKPFVTRLSRISVGLVSISVGLASD